MIDKLRHFLNRFINLPQDEFDALAELVDERKMKKKEHLCRKGETIKQLVFFFEGYFRFYHYLEDGTEVTSDFYFAPNIVTSYTSLITGQPSFVYVQAMEDMNALVLKKSDLQNLYTKYHNFDKLGRILAEQVAITSESHLFNLLNQTAEKRYKILLDDQPHYIQRIPLQYIASYLGITKETLSRIRKKTR